MNGAIALKSEVVGEYCPEFREDGYLTMGIDRESALL
jgi:hypothetical protein